MFPRHTRVDFAHDNLNKPKVATKRNTQLILNVILQKHTYLISILLIVCII